MSQLEANTWFERDRANVTLYRDGEEIFSLWDEDFYDAVESGYLTTPRHPRPSDSDWLPHLVSYAEQAGLL